MILIIDNKAAAIKEGSSFEFVSENRLFSDAEEYSLNIELPLKGCPQNQAIFQNINRKDADKNVIYFPAEIHAGKVNYKGAVAITSISDIEVKVQFIANRSYQNFYPDFDKRYINELNLGAAPEWLPYVDGGENNATGGIYKSPEEAWTAHDYDMVALPWVNAYSGNIQNMCKYDTDNSRYKWKTQPDDADDYEYTKELSQQPFLIYITKLICDSIGYTYDFGYWETSPLRYLIICNTLPIAWHMKEWNKILPKWTITEFFKELELLTCFEFDINHNTQHISCTPIENKINNAGNICLDKVIDEYSVEVTKDNKCDYRGIKNYRYANGNHNMSNTYDCNWYLEKIKNAAGQIPCNEFNTLTDLLYSQLPTKLVEDGGEGRGSNTYPAGKWGLCFVKDISTYFTPKVIKRVKYRTSNVTFEEFKYKDWGNVTEIEPVNLFGPLVNDPEYSESFEELKIIPACIDVTDENNGKLLFVSCGESSQNEDVADGKTHARRPNAETVEPEEIIQFGAFDTITKGEEDSTEAYFDNIFVAFWVGDYSQFTPQLPHPWTNYFDTKFAYYAPSPYTDTGILNVWWDKVQSIRNISLSINNSDSSINTHRYKYKDIEKGYKYSFSFISDVIPNVYATFYIHGKKYLCEKITATFDKRGMSKLLKGTFYQIKD